MNKKNTILDFLSHILIIFGITVICLIVFVALFGEDAKGVSSIFQMGNNGIAITTLLQYLFLAVIITALRMIFFTDTFIKNASIAIRTIAMFVSIVIAIAGFAAVFGWFPVHMWQAWIAFLVCFAVCAAISIVISTIKEKNDNEKLQAALEYFCEREKE